MGVIRKSTKPAGIVNESGQPKIVVELDGFTVSLTPPPKAAEKRAGDPDTDDKA
jgi:hypothetical protein